MNGSRAAAVLVFVGLCCGLSPGRAAGMVIHQDFTSAPLESSIGYTHSSTWQATYLDLDLVPDAPWGEFTFKVQTRKYNYSTPYGTGTIWDGWIETNGATVTEASPGTYPIYIKKHAAGQVVDNAQPFTSGTTYDNPRVVWRHQYSYPLGTYVGFESGGQFLNNNVYSPTAVGGYIGIRLTDEAGQAHYGWMRIETFINTATTRLKVFEWAYEYNPGAPIEVGQAAATPTGAAFGQPINATVDGQQMVEVGGGALGLFADPGTVAVVASVDQPAAGSPGYAVLGAYGQVLALYDVQMTGLDTGESISLVFDLPDGLTDMLQVWHLDDAGAATMVSPDQWAYDGDRLVVSNLTEFSRYGVTLVPEPVYGVLLLASGLAIRRGSRPRA